YQKARAAATKGPRNPNPTAGLQSKSAFASLHCRAPEMLQVIRRYRGSTLEKILFGLLAALFVIWGVGSMGGARVDVVARVDDAPISRRELDHATAALQKRYEDMMKGQFSAEMARSLNLRGQALDQLIDAALLSHEADRLGIAVTDDELVQAITQLPELQ